MIENIIENLLKSCDPNLNNEDRRNSFMIIDNYQNEFFQLDHLKTFLSPSLDNQIKIFGLKCLENFILYKWNTADKETAKSYMIEIIKEYGNFNSDVNSERVMRWIIAKSVMHFIRHECPQNCNTIIMDLINLQSKGIMTKALILSIFYCLSEILPIDNQMPDKRKKEVIGYITENFDAIIKFSLEIIQDKTNVHSNYSINLSTEAVKTIQSFAVWIKFENLNSTVDTIFTVLIHSLIVDSSDFFISEVLETILDRKVKSDDRYATLTILLNNRNNWFQLLNNIQTGLNLDIHPYSDDKFRYLQKLVDLLLVIGSTIINNWSKFSNDVIVNCFDKFIDIIQLATHHPVKLLSIELLSFWYNGFKIDNENLRMILVSKASPLLSLLTNYSMKQHIRNPANVDHEYLVNLIELQDEEAYINRIRCETSKTISTLTEYFTQDIVHLSLKMVFSVIIDIQQLEDNSSFANLQTSESHIMKQLDASRYFTRCVMHNVFRPYSKNLEEQVTKIIMTYPKEIIVNGINIITTILATHNSTVHVITIYLDLLCLLLPFAANHDHIIQQCLEKIFIWFNKVESMNSNCVDYGLWRQLNKNCGVWLLRVFRDYNFIINSSLFESILIYYQSICPKLIDYPIVIEAMTIYICQSGKYSVPTQQAILSQFIDPIKAVLFSNTCNTVFENGSSAIGYLNMNKPAPCNGTNDNYPSLDHQQFRNNIIHATNCLYGICTRISSTEIENNSVFPNSPEAIITCPLQEYIMPMLPCLLKIIRSLNQMWSSKELHSDFSHLREISVFYKDMLINNSNTIEKCHPNNAHSFAHLYVSNCINFVSRLHECLWLLLAKYCSNFSAHLYPLKDWQNSITQYVFTDLDSLPNFKLTPLIKSFIIPFVSNCPIAYCSDVIFTTIFPFINYMFERLDEQWSTIVTEQLAEDIDFEIDLEDGGTGGNNELHNEIIEEQVLRILSKSFSELFRLSITIGATGVDDFQKGNKLGIVKDKLSQANSNNPCPIMLILLNNLCRSITWKDSFCCVKLSQLIQPLINKIHSHGLLSVDIVMFILQQSICALNTFASNNFTEIKIIILNLCVYLYDEYISKDNEFLKRFINLLNKSTEQSIQLFQSKMNSKTSLKIRRDNLQSLLQPYIGVSTNQLFSQEVRIKDLPPLVKAHWKNKNQSQLNDNSEEPLCLEDLFKY